jgi:hypothetical protein
MWVPRGGSNLENAFSILQFRRRGPVSFRRFVVFRWSPIESAQNLQDERKATQPLRVQRSA